MTVLVTNDDGIDSPGLHALARAVAEAGHELTVVAPDADMSGTGAALGAVHLDEHIDARRVELPGLEGVPCFAVVGTPGLCVMVARLGGFGEPPDRVVSGVNPGCNTGRAVLHSGTVGAVLTAANFGGRGIAVSLDVSSGRLPEREGSMGSDASGGDGTGAADAPAQWATAATVAAGALDWLDEAGAGAVLNVNVPNVPLDQLAGMRQATLAPFGTVRATVVEPAADGGHLQMEFRPSDAQLPADSDTALVAAGYVAVSAIRGVSIAEDVDVAGVIRDLAAATAGGAAPA